MSVRDVICEIEAAGIGLRLDGDRIRIRFPEPQQRDALAGQVAFLRTHRDEVAKVLRGRCGSVGKRAPYFWGWDRYGKRRDFYDWRANVAIDAIRRIATPEGLVVWLGQNSPVLYRKLTEELPNEISRAWNDRVSPECFDKLCFELVVTFRRAVEMRSAAR
jgi:hypothetical protein